MYDDGKVAEEDTHAAGIGRDRHTNLVLVITLPHFGNPETDIKEARRIARNIHVSSDPRADVWLVDESDEDWWEYLPAQLVDDRVGRVKD